MSATIIPIESALLRRRDRLDPDSHQHRSLDQRAFQSLFERATPLNLRGLEVWCGNGRCREGLIIDLEHNPEEGLVFVLDTLESDDDGTEQNARMPLWDALSCGWLQEPGENVEPWSDGYVATSRAIARREGWL
jgi:hypothetical protein